jgi:hypothetical protein
MQKANGKCFMEKKKKKKSSYGGIHATRDHDDVRSVLRDTKNKLRNNQNKRLGMLTSGVLVVLLHYNARPHTPARS